VPLLALAVLQHVTMVSAAISARVHVDGASQRRHANRIASIEPSRWDANHRMTAAVMTIA
jgi:hypothetical protein